MTSLDVYGEKSGTRIVILRLAAARFADRRTASPNSHSDAVRDLAASASFSGGEPLDAALASTMGDSSNWTPLIDVSDLSTAELFAKGDSVLAFSVQRLIRSLDDPDGVISAFQSYTS